MVVTATTSEIRWLVRHAGAAAGLGRLDRAARGPGFALGADPDLAFALGGGELFAASVFGFDTARD
ncbi:hypothetical protein [Nocardia sp. NPDC004260]